MRRGTCQRKHNPNLFSNGIGTQGAEDKVSTFTNACLRRAPIAKLVWIRLTVPVRAFARNQTAIRPDECAVEYRRRSRPRSGIGRGAGALFNRVNGVDR